MTACLHVYSNPTNSASSVDAAGRLLGMSLDFQTYAPPFMMPMRQKVDLRVNRQPAKSESTKYTGLLGNLLPFVNLIPWDLVDLTYLRIDFIRWNACSEQSVCTRAECALTKLRSGLVISAGQEIPPKLQSGT